MALAAVLTAGLVVTVAPPAAAADPLQVIGHGWGHGRGLGQYGAFGYARDHGWSAAQILNHFYGGTVMGTADPATLVRVRLSANRTGAPTDLGEITVTSGLPFFVGGQGPFPSWQAVTIRRNANGTWFGEVRSTCGGTLLNGNLPLANGRAFIDPTAPGGTDPGNDPNLMLTLCNAGGTGENRTYRGEIELLFGAIGTSSALRAVNTVTIEQYLLSVVPREMPASWHPEALKSQAVAARSYGLSENRYAPWANTCSTDQCQVYFGFAHNAGGLVVNEDSRTNSAIGITGGQVRRHANGAIARTEFSSSTGGWTAGGTFPAVVDAGDSISANPNHNWSTTIDTAAIGSRYGVGTLVAVEVVARNGLGDFGGRATGVQIRGTSGSVTRTGEQFRADWGLRSDWFAIVPPAHYLNWYLRYDVAPGAPAAVVSYGVEGDRPIAGDWDGNGSETLGVFSRGNWHLRNANTEGFPNSSFSFGWSTTNIPVAGDFDGGDGPDGIGIYDNGVFYLRTTPTPGQPDLTIAYGFNGATPLIGDWDGDGLDTIGIYFQGTFYLRNTNTPGLPDMTVAYGGPYDVPVVGDWDGGSGPDTIGVFSLGYWYLRTMNTPGPPDIGFQYGAPGYTAIDADHDGDGRDTVGVVVVV